VILDPAATLDTPDWLLYCTGIRAVDHAVETYCNAVANPATEALSLQGLKLLAHALPAIKRDPTGLAPRLEAQFGMWQAIAAAAAGVPTGASHGIGYALGATFGVAHGHTSCVMLPAVLKWNAAVNGERQKALSAAMGNPDRAASDLVKELVAGLDQPVSLRAVGIKRENIDELARRALAYQPVQLNPRPIRTAEDVKEILELAW
jgi:maleylacetate reductase